MAVARRVRAGAEVILRYAPKHLHTFVPADWTEPGEDPTHPITVHYRARLRWFDALDQHLPPGVHTAEILDGSEFYSFGTDPDTCPCGCRG